MVQNLITIQVKAPGEIPRLQPNVSKCGYKEWVIADNLLPPALRVLEKSQLYIN